MAGTSPQERPLEDDLGLAMDLQLATARLGRRFGRAAPHRLPPLRITVLAVLEHHGAHSLTELAQRESVGLSTMSRVVAALVARGLADRGGDPVDLRKSRVSITPAGRQVLREVAGGVDRSVGARIHRLAKDDQARIRAVLAVLEIISRDHDPR